MLLIGLHRLEFSRLVLVTLTVVSHAASWSKDGGSKHVSLDIFSTTARATELVRVFMLIVL